MNTQQPFFPRPECYASNDDAYAAFLTACDNGFDGNYNEFLEMESFKIRCDQAERDMRSGAEGLLRLGKRSLVREIAAEILNEAS